MYPAELPPHVRPAPQEHRTIGRLVTQGLLEPDPHFGRAGLGGTVLELGRRLIHVYRDDQGAHLDPASSLPGRSSGRLVSGKMDAPRLVSSDASPTRPECAVTRPEPADSADAFAALDQAFAVKAADDVAQGDDALAKITNLGSLSG